ncbi:MAG: tetratricopeptide repeat protein [Deltaproteobacteria bacterium]|nr:tetratricopeptide repeat protein [Deltaproteobacteria bacterium]
MEKAAQGVQMADFFFISYSSFDGKKFAADLTDNLESGPPEFCIWLDARSLRGGEDWDEQLVEAIRTCKGMIFVMSEDSVRSNSVCKNEWVHALRYKKPIIPIRLDRHAELPFRLGSRQYIDFADSYSSGLARLRKHLSWMDSPEGQLLSLRHRLTDAERELPRATSARQQHIKDDIDELKQQISEMERLIHDPKAAEQRVEDSIKTGLEAERNPAKPVNEFSHGKFINPRPLTAPTWFQDRHVETRQIGEFLKDESLRLITIVGRGGIGKTAMVCRLLHSLEGGKLPDDGGPLMLDGIVYLCAAHSLHRPDFPSIYAGLAKLLPEEVSKQLDSEYRNPCKPTREKMEVLLQAFPFGRTVVLLDSFEDMLDCETGQISDTELSDAMRAFLELPPHGIKIIVTTRKPHNLALVQPGRQRRMDLDIGLGHPFAEDILRTMDVDGKVGLRDAPNDLLAEARERTLGYPRALEHLFGILSADRDTSLQEILADTQKLLPEQVVEVLVGEAFDRLDLISQRIMLALAIYRYPAFPAAIDYLLQPYVAGINSKLVLSKLVNMQFARRDAGRYYLHQVDRDYAISRVAEGDIGNRDANPPPLTRFALCHRAAEWFRLSRKPRESWKSIEDLTAQFSEFELRCQGKDYDKAATVLLEFDSDFLYLWGHYRLLTMLHERLQGNLTEPQLALASAGSLGLAYSRMGEVRRAVSFFKQTLEMAQDQNDPQNKGASLINLANCVSTLGEISRAIELYQEALVIADKFDDHKGKARCLCCIANRYADLGNHTQSITYYKKALQIQNSFDDSDGKAISIHNLGICYTCLGKQDKAQKCFFEALTIAKKIDYRLVEAVATAELGELFDSKGDRDKAILMLQQAIEIADKIALAQCSNGARVALAWVYLHNGQLTEALDLVTAAREHTIDLNKYDSLAILGLIALRQGNHTTAKDTFSEAIKEADRLISLCKERYHAFDIKGLSHCGLAVCSDATQVTAAMNAYSAARALTSGAGIVHEVLRRFDALATVDINHILAGVRSVASGMQLG